MPGMKTSDGHRVDRHSAYGVICHVQPLAPQVRFPSAVNCLHFACVKRLCVIGSAVQPFSYQYRLLDDDSYLRI